MSHNPYPLRAQLCAYLRDPERQREYRRKGRVAVGHTSRNACAATASQPLIELGILRHVEVGAEMLATTMKRTRKFIGIAELDKAQAGDLVVCQDLNGNGLSDHVWWVVEALGGGNYLCLDNQTRALTHMRRLDGQDGKTPARGLLRLVA